MFFVSGVDPGLVRDTCQKLTNIYENVKEDECEREDLDRIYLYLVRHFVGKLETNYNLQTTKEHGESVPPAAWAGLGVAKQPPRKADTDKEVHLRHM
jgi:hypothetical protein